MWAFILEHKLIILLVSFVSFIIVYIFLKQDSSKKKIERAEKPKEEAKIEEPKKQELTSNVIKNEAVKEQPQIITQTIKEEKIGNNETPRGERQESLDNFKNERLKNHVLQLKPAVQAVILKK